MAAESAPESADDRDSQRCPGCGYFPHKKDRVFIEDQKVWHCICYQCNMEWVE